MLRSDLRDKQVVDCEKREGQSLYFAAKVHHWHAGFLDQLGGLGGVDPHEHSVAFPTVQPLWQWVVGKPVRLIVDRPALVLAIVARDSLEQAPPVRAGRFD